MSLFDTIAHALDRAIARVWPAPSFVALPEAEFVVPVEPPAVVVHEPAPLRRGESVPCPVCASPAGRSCCYIRTARKGQFCAPHQQRLDAERPPTRRAATTTGADQVEPLHWDDPKVTQ